VVLPSLELAFREKAMSKSDELRYGRLGKQVTTQAWVDSCPVAVRERRAS
jgi:hypothetical protein